MAVSRAVLRCAARPNSGDNAQGFHPTRLQFIPAMESGGWLCMETTRPGRCGANPVQYPQPAMAVSRPVLRCAARPNSGDNAQGFHPTRLQFIPAMESGGWLCMETTRPGRCGANPVQYPQPAMAVSRAVLRCAARPNSGGIVQGFHPTRLQFIPAMESGWLCMETTRPGRCGANPVQYPQPAMAVSRAVLRCAARPNSGRIAQGFHPR